MHGSFLPNPRQKSNSKVTFGPPSKVTQKLLKSDSKVAKTVEKVTFESLLGNFSVTLAGGPKVTFELLFCVFEFSGVWGSVGEMAGHNAPPSLLRTAVQPPSQAQLMASWACRCHRNLWGAARAVTALSYYTLIFFSKVPKGPSRANNTTTTIEKIVNYYAVAFLLSPQNLTP